MQRKHFYIALYVCFIFYRAQFLREIPYMIYVFISELLLTSSFLVFKIGSKIIFIFIKCIFSLILTCFLLPKKSAKEISSGKYLQIYQGSKTLSTSLNPWVEQLSMDNSVETTDDVCMQVSMVCGWVCLQKQEEEHIETR